MDIVLTTDANYVMPCGVLLLSLCKSNADCKITVHIICDSSVTEKEKSELCQTVSSHPNVTLSFYHIEGELFENYPSLRNAYLSKAAYYRLFLTDILPEDIEKVLYLDCDLLILKSLSDLWNVDIRNVAVAAVIDSMECYHVEWYNRLRYNPSKLYFNSGVMLINLRYWRDHNALSQFMDYLATYRDRIVSHDQDILNVIFQDHKIMLPLEYNLQEGFLLKKRHFYYWDYASRFIEAVNDPVILHYTVNKPWQITCIHPRKELFFEYCDQTLWKGFKLKKYPIKKPLKRRIKEMIIEMMQLVHLKNRPEYPYIDLSLKDSIQSIGGVKM